MAIDIISTEPAPVIDVSPPPPHPDADPSAAVSVLVRQTVEFLIVLALGILLFRTFAAEAYIVPTGSMAPTLLGQHREVACGNCRFGYILGVDEQGRAGRSVCPNCGQYEADPRAGFAAGGDRLLVQKYLFDVRGPRRWEVAVFQSPTEPSQAYVKRVVGLPGEAVLIRGGDLYIDGRIARKDLAEVRATRQLVFDNDFIPGDADRFPRFVFRRGRARGEGPSGWRAVGTRFVHEPTAADGPTVDWLDYRHWDPDSGRYGPVRDFTPYNGGDLRGDNLVTDLMLDARVSARPGARNLVVRVNPGSDVVFVTLPLDGKGEPEARRNGRLLETTNPRGRIATTTAGSPRWQRLEVAVVDRRLLVAIDGELAFDPIDFEGAGDGPGPFANPVSIGVQAGGLEVEGLKIYRDVYYTGALVGSPRRPFAVDEPYVLRRGEYFVLGDNSPVSNDSRFWASGPVVRRGDFLGKPFLIHLPGRLVPIRLFGRPICWIPDPRAIRYIR